MSSIVSQFESNQCRVKAFISVIKKVNYMTTNIEYFLYKLGKNFPFLKETRIIYYCFIVEILFMIIIFIFPNKKHLKYYLNWYYLKTTIKYYKITNSTSLPCLMQEIPKSLQRNSINNKPEIKPFKFQKLLS